MDAVFVQKRITELRMQKGVSELKMSRDLGHSDGYIHHIVAGRSLPSLAEFFYICDYLDVTPAAFFVADGNESLPARLIASEIRDMPEDDLRLLLQLIHKMKGKPVSK